jgi:hypothetical protein
MLNLLIAPRFSVAGWRGVEWSLPSEKATWPKFAHASTALYAPGESSLHKGTTFWVSAIAGRPVGLIWDWSEVADGVPAIADTNRICSNIKFLKTEDHFESELGVVVAHARMVHRIRWQAAALAAIEAYRHGA